MPPLTVWLLRGSLTCLVSGSLVGALLLAGGPGAAGLHPRWRLAHLILLLFGWLVPFVLGTAYWMLPRHAQGHGRGAPWRGRAGAGAYAAGLGLRLAGVHPAWERLTVPGTLMLALGTAAMVHLLWGRVRPFGRGRAGP